MRLTHLKLSGFKSFVEPTNIPTPSDLVGVVGPNGCGKSNIIDAVRWVMGESRASELRGESMQDVIFNGSDNRRPAARASVELLFDNSQARAAGQWSSYSEISVKRIITRDGKNTYYINNQVVRRRDIHDIFLGTGLGARGYAIIGQGMINRLIEAKPEELRFYLEEAAGVSRYKERRRETENRLRDTRENLIRLEDILQELEQQIEKLQQQAAVASKYKDLQSQGLLKQYLLWFLREKESLELQQKYTNNIQEHQTKLEQEIASLRSVEHKLEQLRQSHNQMSDNVHKEQGALYEISSLVSKLETEIKHAKQSKQRIEQRRQELQQQNTQWIEQIEHCHTQIEEVEIQVEDINIKCEELSCGLDEAEHNHPDLNSEINTLATDRDNLNHQINKLQQQLALKHQSITNAQRQVQSINLKIDRVNQELIQVKQQDTHDIHALEQELLRLNQDLEQQQKTFLHYESKLAEFELNKDSALKENQSIKEKATQNQASLKALQDVQYSSSQEQSMQLWLSNNGLENAQPLWQKISIQAGWESALESILKHKITSLNMGDSQLQLNNISNDLPPESVCLYSLDNLGDLESSQGVHSNQSFDLKHLIDFVQIQSADIKALVWSWLHNVFICESLDEAIQKQHKLSVGESIVVPQGHVVDGNSVYLYRADSHEAGLLKRQTQIEDLQKQLKAQNMYLEQSAQALSQAHIDYDNCFNSMDELRTQISELTQNTYKLQLEISSQNQLQAQKQEKQALINDNLQELSLEKENFIAEQFESEEAIASLESDLLNYQNKLQLNLEKNDGLRAQLSDKQSLIDRLKTQYQESQFKQRSLRARFDELKRTLQLAQQQLQNGENQLSSLQGELFNISGSNYDEDLQLALDKKVEQEQVLNQARIRLDELSSQMRETDEQRLRVERSLQPIRDEINKQQLREQEARLSVEQYAQQLNENNVDRAELSQTLNNVDQKWQQTAWLQSEVKRISKDIDNLGAVNMAALQELENASEREQFLQAQNQDLNQAINTLEDAINNIDKETRVLLKDTFDSVNQHLTELFPRLFGGGKAYLTITGQEILDAGIQVMAQPPGKRNSTIQLLSGGEKALTAIALVFAFFKLNPAPFCLLDEVDAPLDDANTGRYAKLVQSMSEQTQFLFISHNKIAMQIAKHLIGVTMQEQGVSRVVAVDMEKALDLAHN